MYNFLEKRRNAKNHHGHDLSDNIVSLSQGSIIVVEYSAKFHTLSCRAEVDEPKYITLGRYNIGFNKPIRDILRLYTVNTIVDAIQSNTILAINIALPLYVFTKVDISNTSSCCHSNNINNSTNSSIDWSML